MKTTLAVLMVMAIAGSAWAVQPAKRPADQEQKAAQVADVKVFTGAPDCPKYEVVSAVSGRGRSAEQAFAKMVKAAGKLGADAVANVQQGTATIGVPTPYGSTLMGSIPVVSGMAVKCR